MGDVAAARERTAGAPEVVFAPPWFDASALHRAVADRVARRARRVPAERRAADAARLHRAQHSGRDGRGLALRRATSRRRAARSPTRLGHPRWSLAYQSRSGSPRDPWLEPDVQRRDPRASPRAASAHVVVVPIGFVCDHVEVLYDLDVEARGDRRRARADAAPRAPAVNDHPGVHRDARRRRPRRRGGMTRGARTAAGRRRRRRHHRARRRASRGRARARARRCRSSSRCSRRATASAAPSRPSACDGFLVEAGPDSFLSEKPWALALCRRLGVEDRLVAHRRPLPHGLRVAAGRLHPLPDGFLLLAPTRARALRPSRLFSWPGKLRMALDLVLPRGDAATTRAWARSSAAGSAAEALERVAQPLVAASTPPTPTS